MPETFVPLLSARNKNGESPFTTLKSRPAASVPAAKPAGVAGEPVTTCDDPKPVITLQRTGEVVTGIRVQCGCGQTIDLACVY